jgi:hypothetical protein
MKTYLRQPQLAKRYDTTTRTIQRMRQEGRLPKPDMFIGPYPLWSEETLDAHDRAAALRAPPPDHRDNLNKSTTV